MEIADVLGLLEAFERLDTPERVAAYAVAHLRETTGARFAEVVAAGPGRDLTVLATADAATTAELMRARAEVEAPPRPDLAEAGRVVVVHDLAVASPWDEFAALAVRRTAVRSAVLPYLAVGTRTGVVVPVSDDRPGWFTPERQAYVRLVGGLTAQALRALADAESMAHLAQGLERRARVGVAVGVLVSRRGITPDDAFALLRDGSQRSGVKLRDLAERVLVEGDLEEPASGSEVGAQP